MQNCLYQGIWDWLQEGDIWTPTDEGTCDTDLEGLIYIDKGNSTIKSPEVGIQRH